MEQFKAKGSSASQEFDLAAQKVAPDLRDPHVVLSLLEADQVFAAKKETRFGKRNFSIGVRMLFWGLRAYVLIMLVMVVISIMRAIH